MSSKPVVLETVSSAAACQGLQGIPDLPAYHPKPLPTASFSFFPATLLAFGSWNEFCFSSQDLLAIPNRGIPSPALKNRAGPPFFLWSTGQLTDVSSSWSCPWAECSCLIFDTASNTNVLVPKIAEFLTWFLFVLLLFGQFEPAPSHTSLLLELC